MMRKVLILVSVVVSLIAADEVAPDAVVAVVNGNKITAGEVRKMYGSLPAQMQEAFKKDPQQFMKEYAWYRNIQEAAEKDGLPEKSPYKEVLQFQRMLTMVNAAHNEEYLKVTVRPEDQRKQYDEHPERYRETQAKLVYIPFTAETEADAKAKAQKVAQEARSGADFVKLVKEYSQDAKSAAQDGDMGIPIRPSSRQIPENVRNAILALKPGQVSDPLRLENGYYVFRAESAGVLPYEKVKDEIYKELKDVGFEQWKANTKAQSSVQFENEAFFRSLQQQPPQPQQQKK
jgi:peptidyl-prolyl cis-trans isomerase C